MKNFLKRAGKDIPITMLEEGSQEAMQEFISVVNEKINDPDVDKTWKERAKELFSQENLDRYQESAAAGAAGGVVFGTGKAAMPGARVQKEGDLDGILRLPAPGDQGGGAAPAPPGAPLTFGGTPAGPTDAEAFGANPVIVDELVKSVDSGMFTLPELDEIRNNPDFMAQHRLTPADIDEATRIIGAREQEEADDAVINRAISGQTTEEEVPAPAANLITPELDDASAVNIFKGKYTGTVDFQPGEGKSGTFRVARAIGSIFGKRVVPVKMGEGYNGAFDPENPGVIFVNEDSPVSAAFIMGHELNHTLEADDADSWNVLMSVAKEEMTPEQFTSYKERLGKKITENGEQVEVSDDDVYREMLADFSGNNFTKQEFWDKVFAKDKNAFEKIVDRMQFIIAKVKESLAWDGAESQKFFKDVQKMEDALAEAVRKHIGPMEASKAASTMKGVTGVTTGKDGVTTTSIKIGEGSTMSLTEDDKTVTIESMGRPGARIEGIREETSDKDKGEPTKVLTKVLDTAKGKGKKVVAVGAAENPYFLKQGFMPLPNGDAVFYPDQTPGKKAKTPKPAKAVAPSVAAPEKAQEGTSVASEATPGTEAPAVSEEPTGGTAEVPAEPEADTLPHRLARAVGKPEQVDLLVKGGHTTEDAQITEIIRDAIINPSIAVNGLRNRPSPATVKNTAKTQAMSDAK